MKWHLSDKGYARHSKNLGGGRKNCKYRTVLMHRFILGLNDRGTQVDHINGNPLDNRKENLRLVNQQQNNFNKKIDKRNTSGYKGVFRMKDRPKWKATIGFQGKVLHLGFFDTKEEAALAYNMKAVELHGEYAKLNIIKEEF
jgi:hypothetical protein